MRRSRVVLALACLLTALAGWGAAEPAPPTVRYRDDRLSVHAQDAAPADVVREIGRASAAEVHGAPLGSAPVTVSFDDAPVKDALARVLGEQSFTLVYGDDGRLRTIELRGGVRAAPSGGAAAAPEPVGWQPSEAARVATDKVQAWSSSDRRYRITGRLSKQLGADDATFSQIAETANLADDPGVRTEALRTAVGLLEAEPEIRDAFLLTLDSVDDAFLVTYCRFFMKDRADELLRGFARYARTPALRTRAESVRETLRVTPAPDAG